MLNSENLSERDLQSGKMKIPDPALLGTPAYLFDLDVFSERCEKVKEYLGEIPLTFSMKANPFLLNRIPQAIRHIEVCSPGELHICKKMGIAPERIIYSGVMKERTDIAEAVSYGVDFLTAESALQLEMENEAAGERTKDSEKRKDWRGEDFRHQSPQKRKVLLRLTSGNQFGMSGEDIENIIKNRERYSCLDIYGIHYYSGTQKKGRQIKKDLERLDHLLTELQEKYAYVPKLVEYGPGAPVEYFEEPYEENEWKTFAEIADRMRTFAEKYPTGVEMGRFLAGSCGLFLTQIKDRKVNSETNYLICDGGIHQLRYYGQTMAMQIPPIRVVHGHESVHAGESESARNLDSAAVYDSRANYMICGSLCTTADILVREVELPSMHIGDYLIFGRCGAYSVTEGSLLFLSRTMPRIYVTDRTGGLRRLRDFMESSEMNTEM